MALNFANTGEKVIHNGSPLGTITDGTILLWLYPTSNTARQDIVRHTGMPDWTVDWRADLSGKPFEGFRQASISYTSISADAANFSAYGINKWLFLVVRWDTTGVATDQKLLMGDLNTHAAEPSSYNTQSAGSGSRSTTNADVYMGNSHVGGGGRYFRGDIAFVGVWNYPLTSSEIIAQQFRPRVTSGCVLFCHYGFNGTGTQPDWSGNGINGTVTGTTQSDHAPISPPFGYDIQPPYLVPVTIFPDMWHPGSNNPLAVKPRVVSYE